QNLTAALAARGVELVFIMPKGPEDAYSPHMRLLVGDAARRPSAPAPGAPASMEVIEEEEPGKVVVRRSPGGAILETWEVPSLLGPYEGPAEYEARWRAVAGDLHLGVEAARRRSRTVLGVPGQPEVASAPRKTGPLYGPNLLEEIQRFAGRVVELVREEGLHFDLIHAHDWTCFPAGLALREATGKPLAVHVHITEYDKTGGKSADPRVWDVEHAGLHGADKVIAVSQRVKRDCVERYFADPGRIEVVYNAAEGAKRKPRRIAKRTPTVLFLGRLTLQKGPDYFVRAAARVLEVRHDVTFVIAGTGDMLPKLTELVAELGIGDRVVFAGFVGRDKIYDLYEHADVFVVPSVSEPFGIVPLEAMQSGVPVILSRQTGASEILRHVLKVDFWDVEAMAERILEAVSYPRLRAEISRRAENEVRRLTWADVAHKTEKLYRRMLDQPPPSA
ncbi:MAG: glycosyltransferase family 4 protein, partial [Myxococcota bacterium]